MVDRTFVDLLGKVMLDSQGRPMMDLNGKPVMAPDQAENENFIQWAHGNGYKNLDKAVYDYIAAGKPRAASTGAGQWQKISDVTIKPGTKPHDINELGVALETAKGRPELQQRILDRARRDGIIE